MIRFKNQYASPPDGFFEYMLDDDPTSLVQDRSRIAICGKIRQLRNARGLLTIGDGSAYLEDYMCRRSLPDGFCSQPSTRKTLRMHEVKARTAGLFGARLATSDVAERRLVTCVSCPQQKRFCLGCTGLLAWVQRGMPGRGVLPADNASGVCTIEEVLTAASASVAQRPLIEGAAYPETCWRPGEK